MYIGGIAFADIHADLDQEAAARMSTAILSSLLVPQRSHAIRFAEGLSGRTLGRLAGDG